MSGNFNPLGELFIAQFARPTHFEPINLKSLTPFQRALLATDGTVTQYIEAYTMRPVSVLPVHQETRPLSAYHIWLEAPRGAEAIFREVIIQAGGLNAPPTFYAYATSIIVIDRLPRLVRDGLNGEGKGLGALLLRSQVETRRDLLWYGLERMETLPSQIAHRVGEPFISRTYRIVAHGAPMMLINERFPFVTDIGN